MQRLPKWPYHFAFPPARTESSCCSTFFASIGCRQCSAFWNSNGPIYLVDLITPITKGAESFAHAQQLSLVQFFETPWTVAHQTPLSPEFFRQEYWSSLPFPPPGDLPYWGTEVTSPTSPALADGFLTNWASWEALFKCYKCPVFIPGIRAQTPSCCHPVANMHTSRNSPSFPCSIPMAHQWFIFREQEAMLVCHHFFNNFFSFVMNSQ